MHSADGINKRSRSSFHLLWNKQTKVIVSLFADSRNVMTQLTYKNRNGKNAKQKKISRLDFQNLVVTQSSCVSAKARGRNENGFWCLPWR